MVEKLSDILEVDGAMLEGGG
jgi:RNA 3'-terminal phosphate cyclase